jgi:hypothetical protein
VLNKPESRLSLDCTLLAVGSDSMATLQAVAHCRTKGICLTVQDMMRGGLLSRIASRATPLAHAPSTHEPREEDPETPFPLSPVQQKLFDFAPAGLNTWNQSIVLRVKRTLFKACDIDRALEAVVRRHPMLRARFVRHNYSGDGINVVDYRNGHHHHRHHHQNSSDGRGAWAQLIPANVQSAYQLSFHGDGASLVHAEAITAAGQRRLDITRGLLLAADVLSVAGGAQLIALMAHHLAVDLVS